MTPIGDNIRRVRLERGLTSFQLSQRAFGDSSRQPDISKWETGRFIPTIETLLKLTKALDCSITDLIDVPSVLLETPEVSPL